MPPLKNTRRERFVQLLHEGLSATAAYEQAGYKPDRHNASRLREHPDVHARLSELQRRSAMRSEIAVADVLRELGRIAFSDIRELFTWDEERACYVPSRDLTPEQASAIRGIKAKTTRWRDKADNLHEKIELEIRTYDKLGALERLGKHLGMFKEQSNVFNFNPKELSDEQLERIAGGEDPLAVLRDTRTNGD